MVNQLDFSLINKPAKIKLKLKFSPTAAARTLERKACITVHYKLHCCRLYGTMQMRNLKPTQWDIPVGLLNLPE